MKAVFRFNMLNVLLAISTFLFCFFVENGTFRIAIVSINFAITLFVYVMYVKDFNLRLIFPFVILIAISLYYIIESFFRGNSYSYSFFVAVLSLMSSFFYISAILKTKRFVELDNILKWILVFNLATFIVQFVLWHLINFDLDYLYMLGVETRPHRSNFYGGYRATGMFSEPSIYATYVFAIISIRYLLLRKTTKSMWLGLLCMCLSFSTMALVQCILYILIVYARANVKSLIALVTSFFIVLIGFSDSLINRVDMFSNGQDSSNLAKTYIMDLWFSDMELIKYGFSYIDKFNAGPEFIALGDLTFWMNNFLFFGVFLGTLISAMYVLKLISPGHMREKLIFSVVFFKLSTLTFPLTSLVLFFFFSLKGKEGMLCKDLT